MKSASELALANLLTHFNWDVAYRDSVDNHSGLTLKRGPHYYIAAVKTASEARSDRVVALLAQAILEAQSYAKGEADAKPLALVGVNELPDALIRRVSDFTGHFASDIAFGLFGADGRRYFQGVELAELTSLEERPLSRGVSAPQAFNLFSDLNQWMLKVLLAPEIPLGMLSAPRKEFGNGADLAEAAQVSQMSVSRFLSVLRRDGFLSSSRTLRLVRRQALFDRWKASAVRVGPEQPFRYLIQGNDDGQLKKFMTRYRNEACVGLFGAADAFGLGHVSGVTPRVYVRKLSNSYDGQQWKGIRPAREGERPDLFLRQPTFPESVFRGAVASNGVPATDAIQVWLDVSSHPARGREQAKLIEDTLINRLIENTT